MRAPLAASDSQPRWPAVYTPAWKLLAISAALGIAGMIVTLIGVVFFDSAASSPGPSSSLTPLWILLIISLLLWALAVAGWAAKKGSSWSAALVAGLVAFATVLGTWTVVVIGGLILLLAISGGG